ncbi:MAG TPA: maleylacetate reductase [Microscillaceae bacterium]|nr:maleylacetate reductase [Microscillaceae bacterium]
MNFTYKSFPGQVHFGAGKLKELPHLLKNYLSDPNDKVLVLAEARVQPQVDALVEALGRESVHHFDKVIQHVPQTLVAEALTVANHLQPKVMLSIGGGSSVGLAKALALENRLPIIAVPTTFAGSEQTNIWGISNETGKTTGRNDVVLPQVVIYDPALTQTMPQRLAVMSAMNAMAHLMEAVYSPTGNPVTRNQALLGMQTLKSGLENIAQQKSFTPAANEQILFGAYLAGRALCEVTMALHHKAAHVLGGSFGMQHAEVHTVLQTYVLAYQWPHLSAEVQQDFVKVWGENPPLGLKNLAANAGAPTTLEEIGFDQADIGKAVRIMLANPYPNPAPLVESQLLVMLEKAFEGRV